VCAREKKEKNNHEQIYRIHIQPDAKCDQEGEKREGRPQKMSPTPPLPPHRPPFSYPFPAPEDRKMGLHYSKKFILTELIFCRRDQPWSSCAGLPMEIWTLIACLAEWEGGLEKGAGGG